MRPRSEQSLSDKELIQLCLARGHKDDRPFHELFERYNTVVWQVCYRYTSHNQDAEDMMQEVFFKVYRSLGQFEGRSSFKTWIYRVATTTCLNELRQRERRPQEAQTDVETMAEWLPSADTVESRWQENQQQSLLKQTMAELPQDIYEILYLKELEQRPYKEIAELLDISVSAAKMRVQRARLAFQVKYKALAGE